MNYLDALKLLQNGNKQYVANKQSGDYSPAKRDELVKGQSPYAVIVTCSDSRVVPEAMFSAGLGELFVIRVAGNVIGEHELGSILYATKHCHTNLVVILGHTHCGAVHATIAGCNEDHIVSLTSMIKEAIGDEKDEVKASKINAAYGRDKVKPEVGETVKVMSALFDIETGVVTFEE